MSFIFIAASFCTLLRGFWLEGGWKSKSLVGKLSRFVRFSGAVKIFPVAQCPIPNNRNWFGDWYDATTLVLLDQRPAMQSS